MVISFSVKQAREQLLNQGVVYSFRKDKRKHVGKDWANSGRGTKKIADVFITEIEEITGSVPHSISRFTAKSGFEFTYQWCDKIRAMNKGKLPQGWIYRVELRNHG